MLTCVKKVRSPFQTFGTLTLNSKVSPCFYLNFVYTQMNLSITGKANLTITPLKRFVIKVNIFTETQEENHLKLSA